MSKPPSAESLLKNMKSQKYEPKTPIASEMFLPNHSGDLSPGKVLTTPTKDLDVVNKKYVDDAIAAGGSGHTIKDEGGVDLTQRRNLNFKGAGVTATDNAGTNSTDVTIPGDATAHTRSHTMTSASDHTAGNSKMFFSSGAGAVTEFAMGASGTQLISNGAGVAPSWVAKDRTIIKIADENLANDAVVGNDSELTISVVADTWYQFETWALFYSASGTPDAKVCLNGPALTTLQAQCEIVNNTGVEIDVGIIMDNWGEEKACKIYGATYTHYRIFGSFICSASGTFALQWAQNTSNASNTTCKAGSYLKISQGNI